MLWRIIFHCVTVYWLASEYSTFWKNTQWELTKGRETSCLVMYEGKKKKMTINFSFPSN